VFLKLAGYFFSGQIMGRIPFTKPALSVPQQIELLSRRGMVIDDHAEAEHYLTHLNYCRLAAYWLPFESDHATHMFLPGTSFRRVLEHYMFDRELRLLVLDAIERLEVSTRALWAHHMGVRHGIHSHLDPALGSDRTHWDSNYRQLAIEVDRSTETFIKHFKTKYAEELPPVWVVSGVMSLGLLSKWYSNIKPIATRQSISRSYGIDHKVLGSWLHHLTYVRNICAHHGRLWNRDMTVTAMIPRSKPMHLHEIMKPGGRKVYNTLVLLDYLLGTVAPASAWRSRLNSLISDYRIDKSHMGFPSTYLP
jgi:abortive infection bacteriophage resistance protein